MISHLNIDSIRNKFEVRELLQVGNTDILMISESKLYTTFPSPQVYIYGFISPYRLDRSDWGVGRLLFERERLITRHLSIFFFSNDIEKLGLNP